MTYDPNRDSRIDRPGSYQPERAAMNITLLLAVIAVAFAIAAVWYNVKTASTVTTDDRLNVQRPATTGVGPGTERQPR